MGDDLLDIAVLRRVGLAAVPADAAEEASACAHWVSAQPGGRGAVRELLELILKAQDRWDATRRGAVVLMAPYITLAALVALLVGLAAGKAWERYKLQDGRWIDRRRARESPHFMLGLNYLVADQIDHAIEELTLAADVAGEPLEIHLILGNLYREKGQVGRAIQEHQSLLQRPNLRKLEHASVLLCLGLDYKAGGFVDRALEAFSEVLRLDPGNESRPVEPGKALRRAASLERSLRDAPKARRRLLRQAHVRGIR